jgi:hypothetical protein
MTLHIFGFHPIHRLPLVPQDPSYVDALHNTGGKRQHRQVWMRGLWQLMLLKWKWNSKDDRSSYPSKNGKLKKITLKSDGIGKQTHPSK